MSNAENALTVDQLIVKLQSLSWQGKGKYKPVADHADGKPHYFTKEHTFELHDDAQIVDLQPHGAPAHRDF